MKTYPSKSFSSCQNVKFYCQTNPLNVKLWLTQFRKATFRVGAFPKTKKFMGELCFDGHEKTEEKRWPETCRRKWLTCLMANLREGTKKPFFDEDLFHEI
jgi:hypothetical protein